MAKKILETCITERFNTLLDMPKAIHLMQQLDNSTKQQLLEVAVKSGNDFAVLMLLQQDVELTEGVKTYYHRHEKGNSTDKQTTLALLRNSIKAQQLVEDLEDKAVLLMATSLHTETPSYRRKTWDKIDTLASLADFIKHHKHLVSTAEQLIKAWIDAAKRENKVNPLNQLNAHRYEGAFSAFNPRHTQLFDWVSEKLGVDVKWLDQHLDKDSQTAVEVTPKPITHNKL